MRKSTPALAFAVSTLLVATQVLAIELLVIPQIVGMLLPALAKTRDAIAQIRVTSVHPSLEPHRQAALTCLVNSANYGDACVVTLRNADAERSKLAQTFPWDTDKIQYHWNRFVGYRNAAYGLYQGERAFVENARVYAGAAGLGAVVAPAAEQVLQAGKSFPELMKVTLDEIAPDGFVVDPVML